MCFSLPLFSVQVHSLRADTCITCLYVSCSYHTMPDVVETLISFQVMLKYGLVTTLLTLLLLTLISHMKHSPLLASMVQTPTDCLSDISFPFYLLIDSDFILGSNVDSTFPASWLLTAANIMNAEFV